MYLEKENKILLNANNTHNKSSLLGSLGGAAVWCLPLAQGVILETRDQIPRRAPGAWSLLLPLPMSLPLSLSLSVTIVNNKKNEGRCSALG